MADQFPGQYGAEGRADVARDGGDARTGAPVVAAALPVPFAAFILVVACLVKSTVEKFYHFVRVRELVWLLETAYAAGVEKPEILSNLD